MEGIEGSCGFHDAVVAFKRRLIEITLRQLGGNRSRAARALGLQRTYLLRLIRDLQVAAPPPPERPAGRRPLPQSLRQHHHPGAIGTSGG
ncbi:MAG: helix-turn-helix domain-containing protein [Candidatus Methylomirabilia bacterium]